jgi:hypothetical protein
MRCPRQANATAVGALAVSTRGCSANFAELSLSQRERQHYAEEDIVGVELFRTQIKGRFEHGAWWVHISSAYVESSEVMQPAATTGITTTQEG